MATCGELVSTHMPKKSWVEHWLHECQLLASVTLPLGSTVAEIEVEWPLHISVICSWGVHSVIISTVTGLIAEVLLVLIFILTPGCNGHHTFQ